MCLRDGSANRLEGSIEACTAADRADRIARAEQKTVDRSTRRCRVSPGPGPDDPAVVNAAARPAPIDLLHDVLGSDLDAAIADARAEPIRWKCQREVVRGLARCADMRVKEFARCAKAGLADDLPDTQEALAVCLAADPRGVVARACDAAGGRIAARALSRRCVAQEADLSVALPGCASDDAGVVATCLEHRAACRVCLALDQAGDLAADCDVIDDGLANASCP
jgi:hypothetical protein